MYIRSIMIHTTIVDRTINNIRVSILLGEKPCEKARSSTDRKPGAFVPKCKPDGTFEEKQCDGSTGYCWCVEPTNGNEIKGTKKGRGEGEVICGINNVNLYFSAASISVS